ncbi:dmt superfamily drug metabolite transporter [Nannochloropsis gaditana CCMP526]|uniref:dmt superfamily drug metabolite transporter n=1 Tax=Nannochloropsis gaditana (strain CCMP526) TaxID=1093141 RepID=UPI00029F5A10|nr:dmt superfamily drug metabolite transporter [Nannochloropsis gaditana CCMP526]EKU22283.1 dmt superfamily drug metabolite transporter [Nannochloropsis gaditana CCMP526]|eukprot:XP_005854079.1 dmt superfamily drug metabolite transporter [Nannochloropsis gaditana CCMP526]
MGTVIRFNRLSTPTLLHRVPAQLQSHAQASTPSSPRGHCKGPPFRHGLLPDPISWPILVFTFDLVIFRCIRRGLSFQKMRGNEKLEPVDASSPSSPSSSSPSSPSFPSDAFAPSPASLKPERQEWAVPDSPEPPFSVSPSVPTPSRLVNSPSASPPLPTEPAPSFLITPALAYLLLNVVTLLWGSQHAVIKSALASSPDYPGVFNLLRFGLASLCFWPWTPSFLPPSLGTCSENGEEGVDAAEKERQGLWRAGAELGIWMFLGFSLQAVGLQLTSASRSGFLLYLNVKLVPLFAWLLLGRRPSLDVVVFALLAFAGTALLLR